MGIIKKKTRNCQKSQEEKEYIKKCFSTILFTQAAFDQITVRWLSMPTGLVTVLIVVLLGVNLGSNNEEHNQFDNNNDFFKIRSSKNSNQRELSDLKGKRKIKLSSQIML